MIIAEYIWLDAASVVRSKTRVIYNLDSPDLNANDLDVLPSWNYDGSSTGQATGNDSEIIIKPVAFYKSPFFDPDNNTFLVLCDTYLPDGTPHVTNHRHKCKQVLDSYLEDLPMFGFEQEFFLIDKFGNVPAFVNQTKDSQLNTQGNIT